MHLIFRHHRDIKPASLVLAADGSTITLLNARFACTHAALCDKPDAYVRHGDMSVCIDALPLVGRAMVRHPSCQRCAAPTPTTHSNTNTVTFLPCTCSSCMMLSASCHTRSRCAYMVQPPPTTTSLCVRTPTGHPTRLGTLPPGYCACRGQSGAGSALVCNRQQQTKRRVCRHGRWCAAQHGASDVFRVLLKTP